MIEYEGKHHHSSYPAEDDGGYVNYNPISGEAKFTVEIWKDFVKKLECNE